MVHEKGQSPLEFSPPAGSQLIPDAQVSAVQVQVERPSNTVAKVKLTVEPAEFQQEFQSGLKAAGRNVRMKGFRPGKVPAHVLEKNFGDEVRQRVREFYLQKAYSQAVEEESLKPISHPRVDMEGFDDEKEGFEVTFELALRPEVELPEYKGLEIDSELEPVLDQEIDDAISELKRQQSSPEPVGDDGLAEDGVFLADVAFVQEETTHFEREGLRLSPTTPPPGIEPEAFKEAVLGAKDGDVLELAMTLPDVIEDEAARGQDGTCRVTVKEAYKMVPPEDSAIFAMVEVESEEELKTKVRERLGEAKEQREQNRIESALLSQLIEKTTIDLPDSLLDEQTEARLKQLHDRMAQQGVEHDEIHKMMEEQRPTAREEAAHGLRALMLVEAIGEKEELLVNAEDIQAELATIAERNNTTVEEVREYYSKNNIGQQMTIEILERKVRTFLRENAEVQKPS